MYSMYLEEDMLEAAEHGRTIDMLEKIKLGANILASNTIGLNIVHLAALHGHIGTLEAIVKVSNELSEASLMDQAVTGRGFDTFFCLMANTPSEINKNSCILTKILVTAKDNKERTALHLAASKGHDDIVNCLLNYGCYINVRDVSGNTPLSYAAFNGKEKTVSILLSKRAKIGASDNVPYLTSDEKNTSLHIAAAGGNIKVIEMLLHTRTYTYINSKNTFGYTPICFAAEQGMTEAVTFLTQKGAKLNKSEIYSGSSSTLYSQNTPLMLASKNGHISTVIELIRLGAKVDETNVKGNTALHFAAQHQQKDVVRFLLLEAKIDYLIINHDDELALNLLADRQWVQDNLKLRSGYQSRVEHNLRLYGERLSHFVCALFCRMSSLPFFGKSKPKEIEEFEIYRKIIDADGWISLKTSEEYGLGESEGYYGIAFYQINYNTRSAEIVIAHRGACNIPNLLSALEIFERKNPSYLKTAVKPYVEATLKDARLKIEQDIVIDRIIHTGFSLGGFTAASICNMLLPTYPQMFAVTFDAPGINYLPDICSDLKDKVVNYVSTINLVNSCNKHIGLIRRLSAFPENPKYSPYHKQLSLGAELKVLDMMLFQQLMETLESHELKKIIELSCKYHSFRYEEVFVWPTAEIEAIRSIDSPVQTRSYYSSQGASALVNTGLFVFQAGVTTLAQFVWEATKINEGMGEKGISRIIYKHTNQIYYTEQAYQESLKIKQAPGKIIPS